MKAINWFKTKEKRPIEELEPKECPNCQTTFQGYYCPNCGQSDTEFDRPFGFVMYDFMGNFFSFDSRFFKTFWYLMSRPGFLTMEFLLGRRERYAPPFRTFIFLSFILFLLLQTLTGKALREPFGADPEMMSDVALSDSINEALKESELIISEQLGDSAEVLNLPVGTDFMRKGSLEEKFAVYADEITEKIKTETDPKKKENLRRAKIILESPRVMNSTILKYLSWAFFIMLPVFALMLALFYVRKKMNFIRHLVFSVHIHSFVFLVNIVVVALALIWHLPFEIYFAAFLVVQVYIFLALKRFYGQKFLKTFFKFITLGAIYSFSIIMALVWVVYNAFMAL